MMGQIKCFEVEMNEQRDITRSQSESFTINVTSTPPRGSLILHENDFYAVLDILYQSDSNVVLSVVKMDNGVVPEFYKDLFNLC